MAVRSPRRECALSEAVCEALVRRKLIIPGGRVLVGVSGGADSVALLHSLATLRSRLRLQLIVVHVNHGLRPEADADAAFVQDLARRWRLVCAVERVDARLESVKGGWSLEDGARRARYACFSKAAREYSAGSVALAHTADDQAETVLLRLLRGSGLTGLSAIPWKRPLSASPGVRGESVWVVRPLLGCWREEILEHIRSQGLSFREDASNRDLQFLRNRVRHELIPLLETINPGVRRHLAKVAEQLQWDGECLAELTKRYWKRVSRSRAGTLELSVAVLRRMDVALQRLVLREAVRRLQGGLEQFEFRHWAEWDGLIGSRPRGSVVSLPGGLRFERGAAHIRCWRETGLASVDAAGPGPQEPEE